MPVLQSVPDAEKERAVVSSAGLDCYVCSLRRTAGYTAFLDTSELQPLQKNYFHNGCFDLERDSVYPNAESHPVYRGLLWDTRSTVQTNTFKIGVSAGVCFFLPYTQLQQMFVEACWSCGCKRVFSQNP